jgi:hypothetical protein
MNKKVIAMVVIIILLLLVVGAGAVMMMKKPYSLSTAALPTTTQLEQTQTQNNPGTLRDLLTAGKTQKCTFSDDTKLTTNNITIYAANGKIRGDIITNTGKLKINSHVIYDSSYSYIWTDNNNKGFKFPITQPSQVTPSSQNGSLDLNKKVNYICENWNEDDSVFQLPTDINFQTMTIPSIAPTGTKAGSSSQCAVCNDLPAGEAQTACKTQLKCQ